MNASKAVIRKELLINQNLKLQEECNFLKERFVILKKKISQPTLIPLEATTLSRKNLEIALKKQEIYRSEYESLLKQTTACNENSDISALENSIKQKQEDLKRLEKENHRLNKLSSRTPEPSDSEQDLAKEIISIKQAISKLEQAADHNTSVLSNKQQRVVDLEQEFLSLNSQIEKSYKPDSKNKSELKRYLKALQGSFASKVTKYLNTISKLEEELSEYKQQEIISQSTLIKKQQQHRLLAHADTNLHDLPDNEKGMPDIRFYYKPAIKYLYT